MLLLIFLTFFIWSLINPYDYLTWVLEVFPAVLGLTAILFTYKSFCHSNLAWGTWPRGRRKSNRKNPGVLGHLPIPK